MRGSHRILGFVHPTLHGPISSVTIERANPVAGHHIDKTDRLSLAVIRLPSPKSGVCRR